MKENKVKNARYANGNLRRKNRARFKAMGSECGICHGRFGPIHYDEPSDSKHPLSFVIDEIHPISLWKQYGYDSPRQAAEDFNNLQAAHYFCNAKKSNKINFSLEENRINDDKKTKQSIKDGEW